MRRHDRRGVALIFVLGLLVFLGVIATEVGSTARLETNMVASLRARTVARYVAESGTVVAKRRIEALLDSADSPAERSEIMRDLRHRLGDLTEVRLGRARFGIAVVDLNARIDLNRAEAPTLVGLFRQFTGATRAELIVAALKANPVVRVSDLPLVPGVGDAVAVDVAPYVTVWSDGIVNINSAPEAVLAALPGLGPAEAKSLIERRDAGELFSGTSAPEDGGMRVTVTSLTPARLVSTVPTRLLVVARGWDDSSPLTHELQSVYAVVGTQLVLQGSQERDL
ncbi:MAG TPA: type II secretion system protein GspK [Gemmatimonadales bacterium]|jgi:type II secretory pathway component PulK|nr:type II secretion system protein GspK [Gemmatimonadales bacterium]